jgi:mono/diheme cytochrome c family protein
LRRTVLAAAIFACACSDTPRRLPGDDGGTRPLADGGTGRVDAGNANDAAIAGDGGADTRAGEMVYRSPVSNRSAFACSSCHALDEPPEDGFRRVGHQLGDATHRPSYLNGRFREMLDAVNVCLTEWMTTDRWTPDDPRWLALFAFLDARAPAGPAPEIRFEIVGPPMNVAGGDSVRGRDLFNTTCALCHGTDGFGGLGPRIKQTGLDAAYVARRIRRSGPPRSMIYEGLLGGVMPFWGANRLSDAELLDLVAYVVE